MGISLTEAFILPLPVITIAAVLTFLFIRKVKNNQAGDDPLQLRDFTKNIGCLGVAAGFFLVAALWATLMSLGAIFARLF